MIIRSGVNNGPWLVMLENGSYYFAETRAKADEVARDLTTAAAESGNAQGARIFKLVARIDYVVTHTSAEVES